MSVGASLDAQTLRMDLGHADWVFPNWLDDLGVRPAERSFLIRRSGKLVHQAQLDGIAHVSPILFALGCSPNEAKKRFGRAAWRRVHHSAFAVNRQRARILLKTEVTLPDLILFPDTALFSVEAQCRQKSRAAVLVAGRLSSNRDEFIYAAMLADDLLRMGGKIDPAWTLRRLEREHDVLGQAIAVQGTNPTPWHPAFVREQDGFKFTLLRSQRDFAVEGQRQQHCIASYGYQAFNGSCMVFKLEGPVRATALFSGKPPKPREIKARYNRSVSKSCKDACEAFAREHLQATDHLGRIVVRENG